MGMASALRCAHRPAVIVRMDFDTPDDWQETLRITFERLREAGYVQNYTLEGLVPVSVAWTSKGLAALAILRKCSQDLKLTEGKGVAVTVCWLAEQFGPDIAKPPR